MPRRLSGSTVTVSFSTRGALMPAWMIQHVAAIANVVGVDVDATSPFRAWLAGCCGSTEYPYIPVRSLWTSPDGLRSSRIRRLIDSTLERQPDAPPLIVVALPGAGTLRDLSSMFQPAWTAEMPSRVAIGLPSMTLRGGRPHLVQLGGIRRFAEEWDLLLAIDLTGRFDPTWEAEAAVARVGGRLHLLRMSVSAPSQAAIGRDRVACRALHAAIDRADRLEVVLSSARPVPFPVTPRAAARAAERAADYVTARAISHAEALRDGISRFEGSPTSRGN